jgi:hypothetical protein
VTARRRMRHAGATEQRCQVGRIGKGCGPPWNGPVLYPEPGSPRRGCLRKGLIERDGGPDDARGMTVRLTSTRPGTPGRSAVPM